MEAAPRAAGPWGPRVRAVLGPTNTGKTHLAMTRLMAHASGIIGFPLRLLARENYDRLVAAKGARHVALITGEEKILPAEARWFSCTTEAMPLDRPVEFLAVDEIQLCADPDRGHIFTDRLLRARGLVETMFMGADTIRPLIERLVPGVEVETRPRLSRLSHAGPQKLAKLPPRSAIVAFSAGEVYAIAEAVRRRRGGCAVVMGRLSPRTRNAQVALYQEGEVDFLVATDAIGMGLNMDVNHVAFAGLAKFDGHRPRGLTAPEIAQIAGRAGRGMRDGTFGTTATCPPLSEELAAQVEAHAFEPLDALCWRNAALDFRSVDSLLASLAAAPPRPGLVHGRAASDEETLASLAQDPEVRHLAQGPRRLRALWEACQIPDFRKITDDSHVRLCARIFGHIARGERLPAAWLEQQFAQLSSVEGDIDTLMQRLTGVRVWSYIAARADWVGEGTAWPARARDIEDRISDALHERLTARFVDRRAAHLLRRLEAADGGETLLSAVTGGGEVVVEGHPVGHVAGFRFLPDPAAAGADARLVLRAARRALYQEMPRRVGRLEGAADAAVTLGADLTLRWDGAVIARLRPGPELLRPAVEVESSEFLDGPQRERVRARLAAWVEGRTRTLLAPLFAAAGVMEADPALRGSAHRLTEAGGVAIGAGAPGLAGAALGTMRRLGVRAGRFALFMPALLKPRALEWRAVLWALWARRPAPSLPDPGRVSVRVGPGQEALLALGFVAAGPVLLRLDVAERVAAELAYATRRGPAPLPPALGSSLGLRAAELAPVLRALGFRLRPAPTLEPRAYGPPAPPRIVALPRRRAPAMPVAAAPARADGPFAALAAWRR